MSSPQMVELFATEASTQIRQALQKARSALLSNDRETMLDSLVSALGLALQLGPAATERALAEVMAAARELARQRDADALSTLGPALVALIDQVREARALPSTAVMEAWAAVASGLGALFGELGLVLAIAPDSRLGMMTNAALRARFLDGVTDDRFEIAGWLDELAGDLLEDDPARG
ncbi:MAG: hypothetical protein GWN58_24110 [Anaerolineae bacterium]|nr:hypothetical protein [Anaerolineae bacterium]